MSISSVELKLFGISRIFCFVGASIGLAVIIISLVVFGAESRSDTKIGFDDVKMKLAEKTAADAPATPRNLDDAEVPIPENIQKELGGEKNLGILHGWMESLNADQKRDFLSNMSDVIEKAKKNSANTVEYINQYQTMKMEKMMSARAKQEGGKWERMMWLAAALVGILTSILFSIVLALLAIERNTRPKTSA